MRTIGKVHVDNYTRVCLTLIAVLLTVLVLALWVQGVPSVPSAQAAEQPFGDSAATRQAMVDEQKETNRKLGDIIDLLKGGQIKVQVVESDKAGDKK